MWSERRSSEAAKQVPSSANARRRKRSRAGLRGPRGAKRTCHSLQTDQFIPWSPCQWLHAPSSELFLHGQSKVLSPTILYLCVRSSERQELPNAVFHRSELHRRAHGRAPGALGLDPDSTGRCMQTRRNRAQLAMDACCSVGFGAIGAKIPVQAVPGPILQGYLRVSRETHGRTNSGHRSSDQHTQA